MDQSHRKLAHRGSRLAVVHASEPTVLRVLAEAGIHLPSAPPREPRPARPWPEWAELVPGVIWIYDFTHFTRAKRCAVAVLDVVSRYWLATVVSAEESSTQVEVAFTRALITDGKEQLLDDDLLAELASGEIPEGDDRLPVLAALSDNGPQMTSKATAAFMAGACIAQHFGLRLHARRPGLGRVVLRPPQGRVPAPGEDPRPRRAGSRTGPAAHPLQHDPAARGHRLRHPRRRAPRPRPRHPRRPPRRPERRPRSPGCSPPRPTTGSPMSPHQRPGITPANWCIFSDAPRPPLQCWAKPL